MVPLDRLARAARRVPAPKLPRAGKTPQSRRRATAPLARKLSDTRLFFGDGGTWGSFASQAGRANTSYLSELTVRIFLPFARRLARTRRPPGLFIRARKPWVLARRRRLGWNVLFGIDLSHPPAAWTHQSRRKNLSVATHLGAVNTQSCLMQGEPEGRLFLTQDEPEGKNAAADWDGWTQGGCGPTKQTAVFEPISR